VPAISDEQWLSEHDFYVTDSGRILLRHMHCEPAGVFTAEVVRDMTPDYEAAAKTDARRAEAAELQAYANGGSL
jgi:hypothetical protein